MQGDASPHAIYDGMQSFLSKVNSLVLQQEALLKQNKAKQKRTEEVEKSLSCDDMLMRLVNQSVNSIWNDFDTSKDGYLSLEESHDFIKESFGKT